MTVAVSMMPLLRPGRISALPGCRRAPVDEDLRKILRLIRLSLLICAILYKNMVHTQASRYFLGADLARHATMRMTSLLPWHFTFLVIAMACGLWARHTPDLHRRAKPHECNCNLNALLCRIRQLAACLLSRLAVCNWS